MRDATRAIAALRALPCGARLLEAFGDTEGVWLVGGAVRDLLLGRAPRELDLLVLGSPEEAAVRLGTVTERHERFGTLKVAGGTCDFDIARARTETYARPGALPDVQFAETVREDLRRRDFTINAIALSLHGEIVAVADALEDLGARRLRVLHERSFLDDPTRLWRLARYQARLKLGVEPFTAQWAAEAVAGGATATVSPERIGSELRLALNETDPCAALATAVDLELISADVDRDRVHAALELLGTAGRRDLTVAGACRIAVEGLGFTRAEETALDRARTLSPGPAAPRSAIAAHFRREPLEAVAVAGGPGARWWLQEGRHVGLEITGEDLLQAGMTPGPELGAGLQRALDAKLDGVATTRAEELSIALGQRPDSVRNT